MVFRNTQSGTQRLRNTNISVVFLSIGFYFNWPYLIVSYNIGKSCAFLHFRKLIIVYFPPV